jgi:hypothetical protein
MDHEKAHGNRQRQQVNQLKRRYRNAWTQADALRREQRHTWPDWCYVPIRHWRDMAQAVGPNHEPPVDAIIDAGRLAALGAWRVTQGIYRFDPNLYAALINTPLTGDLPHELLYRLPRWCVYIETPGLSVASQPIIGYYAHLNQQENGRTDLRLLIDSDAENGLFPISIPLEKDSLLDALQANLKQDAAILQPLLSLLLYLCADDADYERPPRLKTARPRSLGKERIVIIPNHARYWDVGTHLGAALRTRNAAELSNDHAPPRAHWHTFWTGPQEGEHIAHVQWLPPITLNIAAQDSPRRTDALQVSPHSQTPPVHR